MDKNKKHLKRNKKRAVFLIGIIIILTVAYFIFFFLNKYKTEIFSIPSQKNSEEEKVNDSEEYSIETRAGYLVKLNENSIDFITLEKSRSDYSEEEKQKSVETFNISLTNPTTPITRGNNESKEAVNLSDLKVGQEIVVAYDKETRDVIRININEDNKK